MIANGCGKKPCSARLQRAGVSFRLLRSPAPPEITMMQGSPLRFQLGLFTIRLFTSASGSNCASPMRLCPPYPKASCECVGVIALAGPGRQMFEFPDVATTQDNFLREQGIAKLFHNLAHVLLPLLFAQPLQTTNTDVVFVGLPVLVGQVGQLHWLEQAIHNHGRTQTRTQTQKKHAPALVAAERLHGGIVDDFYRPAKGSLEVEVHPAGRQQLCVRAPDVDHQHLGSVSHPCFPTVFASGVAFFSMCPPKAKRIAESNLSAKSDSPRELKR